MYIDLKAAGIPKWTPEGKVDFHAARTAYPTLLFESGASLKEAQDLARHATPMMTANTYARSRHKRLAEVAERVGETLLSERKRAIYVLPKAVGLEDKNGNTMGDTMLPLKSGSGAGGNRIRRPSPAYFFAPCASATAMVDIRTMCSALD